MLKFSANPKVLQGYAKVYGAFAVIPIFYTKVLTLYAEHAHHAKYVPRHDKHPAPNAEQLPPKNFTIISTPSE
ncbi:hypothetical protein [Salinibacillus xinjiangensis]|uniref:Uncharacterized protein n=1 Tax=Salinibacillus xinjiangensis TaxID=1229268 RepID=A0A6G1X4J6_9BACI|nr:hypothetical protein [Salinibacillus xinjiangensis]MRG85826.1 hypothetical protein [Salinibacillus xinjiangensis]